MQVTATRAKLVLLVLAVALVGLGSLAWEPAYLWVTYESRWFETRLENHAVAERLRFHRWTGIPLTRSPWSVGRVGWYRSTGFKAWQNGERGRTTWYPDGTLRLQFAWPGSREYRFSPPSTQSLPWWWGVTDQTAPSAPAWVLADEQWQAALDAQE